MTWYIDTGRFPVVSTVDGSTYSGGTIPRPPDIVFTRRRSPFDDETRNGLPKSVEVHTRDDGYQQHILIDQRGYLFLSKAAIDVLARFQKSGWQAIPIAVSAKPTSRARFMAGDTYYILHTFLHRNIVDLKKSNVPPEVIHKGTPAEKTVWRLTASERRIAIKHQLIGEVVFWLGDGAVFGMVYFVADRLKHAWCEIGMKPAVFETCFDI